MIPDIKPIGTRRCRIVALRREDASALLAITDASVTSRIHFLEDPFTLTDAEALIAAGETGHRFFGVWERGTAVLLGVVGANPKGGCEVEVGYWFAAAARGRGIAAEAVTALTRALADATPGFRIVAECSPENLPSWKLLERVGFVATGKRGDRPGRERFSWRSQAGFGFDVC